MTNEEEEEFPKAGVKLSFILNEFVPQNGGTDAFQGWTTKRVCKDLIIPQTKNLNSSYCSLLRDTQHSAYGSIAEIFISHAHCYYFLDVLSALAWHLRDELDTVIWFDLFSINQHRTTNNNDWSFEWLSGTFQSAIGEFGRLVMVMSPWNDPLPFTRSWCVVEAYCAAVTGASLEIALSAVEEEQFLKDISKNSNSVVNSIDQLLGTIRAEKSEASVAEDRRKIFAAIQSSIGFSKLDSMVFDRYRDWVVQVVSKAFTETCSGNEEHTTLLKTLGIIYRGQGKFVQAEDCLERHLEEASILYGKDSLEVWNSNQELAELYREWGMYEKSLTLHRLCLEHRTKFLGIDHVDTLQSMNDMAKIHACNANYSQAQELYEDCWTRRKHVLGESDPETLLTQSQLANLYHHQQKFEESRQMLEDSLKKRREVLGIDHPMTLISMRNLAGHYLARGNQSLALHLYEQTFEMQTTVLGSDHPQTLVSMNNLASLYRNQGNHDQSLAIYRKWLDKTILCFGDDRDTLSEISGIANYFFQQGNLEEARNIWKFCLEKQRQLLGERHEDTNMTKVLLNAY